MSTKWTLRLSPDFQLPIEKGFKTIDLRIPTQKNRRLIEEMLKYQPGDSLRLQFVEEGKHRDEIIVTVTHETTKKLLGELTDKEVQKISGLLALGKIELIRRISDLYRRKFDLYTEGYLAHFAVTQETEIVRTYVEDL